MKDRERDLLRKTILGMLSKDHVHYTDLEKKVTVTCHSFATTNTFKRQLRYLLDNAYVKELPEASTKSHLKVVIAWFF